ncbi:MAG: hypothetical protein JW819_03265 [Candidatus Krumholzibacteriota bacterium]|nr:hypothetical protein [Candidatus Krumholzibacteriota bacterium]
MQETFSLGTLLGILWRHRFLVIVVTLAVALAAVPIALLLPRQYVASASIMPESERSANPLVGMLAQNLSGLALDFLGSSNPARIQREILASFTVRQRVVEGLDLYKPYALAELRGEDPQAALWEAVTKLANDTRLEILEQSDVLVFSVRSREAELSRRIAERYLAELERFNREMLQEAGRRKRVFLAARLDRVRADQDAAREALRAFAARHGVVYLPSELESQLALVAELNKRLVLKELERAALAQDAAPASPARRRVDAEIAVLRGKLREMETGGEESDLHFPALDSLPALTLEYFRLQRELTVQQGIGELLLQQVEQARLQETSDVPMVRILDPPRRPILPAWPRKKLIVIAAALAGFVLACLLALARDFLDRVRRDEGGRYGAWRWLAGRGS